MKKIYHIFTTINARKKVISIFLATILLAGIHIQADAQTNIQIIGPDTVCLPLSSPVRLQAQVNGVIADSSFSYSWFSFSLPPGTGPFYTLNPSSPSVLGMILQVRDSLGGNLVGQATIAVHFVNCSTASNIPPNFSYSGATCAGNPIMFFSNANSSGQVPDSSQISLWDMGDGTSYAIPNRLFLSHQYTLPGTYLVEHCVVTPSINDTTCTTDLIVVQAVCRDTARGYLYIDNNGNGFRDAGDSPLAGYPVTFNPGGAMAFSDSSGFYKIALPFGTYTYNPPSVPGMVLTSPSSGSYTYQLLGYGRNWRANFGYTRLSSSLDLKVRLLVSPPPRPGFRHCVNAYYSNFGSVDTSGTVTIKYDPKATFQPAFSSANSSHDAVNRTVSWTFSNLQAATFNERVFACFTLPANTPLGSTITSIGSISPIAGDANPANNRDTTVRTVIGAFDPNDKQVDQPAVIQGNEWLGYMIRFQNTGTDTAFNVVVRDTLDPNLDLSTLELLGTSHPGDLSIDANREAVWTFPNILLPDSGTNEPLSHGHILYRVKAFYPLVPGTTIENTASIYFDFNSPIVTNTTVNSIAFPLFFGENEGDMDGGAIAGLQMFPNPASKEVSVTFHNEDEVAHQISLVGVDGKTHQRKTTKGNAVVFRLDHLVAGMYMMHISNTDGLHTWRKLVVK